MISLAYISQQWRSDSYPTPRLGEVVHDRGVSGLLEANGGRAEEEVFDSMFTDLETGGRDVLFVNYESKRKWLEGCSK